MYINKIVYYILCCIICSLDSYVRAIGCKMNIKKITAELGEKLEIKSAILQLPLRFPEAIPRKAKARR